MTEQLPGTHQSKFSPFSRFQYFFLSSKTFDLIDNIQRLTIILFKELYVWIFILRKTPLKLKCKNEKDKYFAICQKDKFTFSSIKPLFPTRWLLIYWSPEALRPVRQKNSGDTNLQLHHTTNFLPHIIVSCVESHLVDSLKV